MGLYLIDDSERDDEEMREGRHAKTSNRAPSLRVLWMDHVYLSVWNYRPVIAAESLDLDIEHSVPALKSFNSAVRADPPGPELSGAPKFC